MENDVNKAFGKRVAELRKNAGYSQEKFAFKCGVDRTYVGVVERGEKSPTLNTIEKIANALDIPLLYGELTPASFASSDINEELKKARPRDISVPRR